MLTLGVKGYLAKDFDGTAYIYLDKPDRDKFGVNHGKLGVLIFAQDLTPPTLISDDPIECEITITLHPKNKD